MGPLGKRIEVRDATGELLGTLPLDFALNGQKFVVFHTMRRSAYVIQKDGSNDSARLNVRKITFTVSELRFPGRTIPFLVPTFTRRSWLRDIKGWRNL